MCCTICLCNEVNEEGFAFFCCQDVVPREFRYCSFSRSRNISVRCARDVIYLIDIASISDQLS